MTAARPSDAGAAALGPWGWILAAGATAMLAAQFFLPWVWTAGMPTGTASGRAAFLGPGSTPYENHLVQWPVWAWAALAVLGLGLACLRWLPSQRAREGGVPVLVAACAAAGFVPLLVGVRWLGFYLARALDGPLRIHLHVVPYLDLLGGALVMAAALRAMARHPAWRFLLFGNAPALAVAGIAAGALLLLPLVPQASAPATVGTFHYDELTLAGLRAAYAQDTVRAPRDLEWARDMLWLLFVTAGVVAILGPLARRRPAFRHVRWLPLLPTAALAYTTVLFFMDLPRLGPGTKVWYNPALPLACLGALAAHAVSLRKGVRARGQVANE